MNNSTLRLLAASLAVLWGAGCGQPEGQPEYCLDRADDGDCDGVPDSWDRCSGSELGQLTDQDGCTGNQLAGCSVQLSTPVANEALDPDRPVVFRWAGSCDRYLVQFSNDPDFPPGATRTGARVVENQAEATGSERYWRVLGGVHGRPQGYASEPREVRWK